MAKFLAELGEWLLETLTLDQSVAMLLQVVQPSMVSFRSDETTTNRRVRKMIDITPPMTNYVTMSLSG
jgi:hypothetical protein